MLAKLSVYFNFYNAVTVTSQIAVLPPSWVLTIMVARPGPTAVTTPLLIDAILLLVEDHSTLTLVALSGLTDTSRVAAAPTLRLSLV